MHDRNDRMTSSRTLAAFTAVALAFFSLVGAAVAQPHDGSGPEIGLPSSELTEAMPMIAADVPISDRGERGDHRSEAAHSCWPSRLSSSFCLDRLSRRRVPSFSTTS